MNIYAAGTGVILLMTMAAVSAQAGTREIRASILDPYGHPVPGAGLYVEASTYEGEVYDFAFALAGQKGEVPASGRPPLKINSRRGSNLSYLAMAPGKECMVIHEYYGRQIAEPSFILRDAHPDYPNEDLKWQYPFRDKPELANKAAQPEYAELRKLLALFTPPREKVFELPEDYIKTDGWRPRLFISPDGRSVACAYAVGDRHFVNINGRIIDGKNYVSEVVFSADGRKWGVIYLVEKMKLRPGVYPRPHIREKDSYVEVNVNGEVFGKYNSAYDLGFLPDGKTFWFFYLDREDKKHVVVNGKDYSGITNDLRIENDGALFHFIYRKAGMLFAHVNGLDYEAGESILRGVDSIPGGWWFKYKRGAKEYLNINGQVLGGYDAAGEIEFSPDGKHFHFAVVHNGRQRYIADGKEVGEYTAEKWLLFHPDGTEAGYARKRSGEILMDLNGKTFGPYNETGPIMFSPDGSRFGFEYTDKTGHWLNINGKMVGVKKGQADGWGMSVFSRDCAHGAFDFTLGRKAFLNVDGRIFEGGESIDRSGFSPDGRNAWFIFYVPKGNFREYYLNINGENFGGYWFVEPPVFTSDSGHFYFKFEKGSGGDHGVNVDGTDYQTAEFIDGAWMHTAYGGERWAFSYIKENFQSDSRRYIHLNGRAEVRSFPVGADGSVSPHALTLLPDGRAVLVYLNKANGAVMREIIGKTNESSADNAAPLIKLQLPQNTFSWGEPILLQITLFNRTGGILYREDPMRSVKTRVRLTQMLDRITTTMTFTLSGKCIAEVWNGKGPYPVPALELAPDASVSYQVDLLERLAGRGSEASPKFCDSHRGELFFSPGRYECLVQDRAGESAPAVFSVQWTRASVPALLRIVKNAQADKQRRRWASGELSRFVETFNVALRDSRSRGSYCANPFSGFTLTEYNADAEAKLSKGINDFEKRWEDIENETVVDAALRMLNGKK
jgi:hypothetical protein